MGHSCHAIACSKNIPPKMLMCRRHWGLVSKGRRARVWATYRDGQCDDLKITRAYAVAAQAAIRMVAGKEGRVVTGEEDELTLYDHLVERETRPQGELFG